MGSFVGAEIRELVGLFLLHQLSLILDKNDVGLHRDDGLAVLRNSSSPDAEKMRKKVTQAFRQDDLRVTIDTNSIQTDFLDVTLNLSSNKYWPFRKPNYQPLYFNVQSNHHPLVIKQIPAMIEKRISTNSCNEIEFARSLPIYKHALRKSGYKTELTLTQIRPIRNLAPT